MKFLDKRKVDLLDDKYWLENLILADAIAIAAGLNRAAAINRCAKRMRDTAVSPRMRDIARRLLNANDALKIKTVEALVIEMRKDGLL